MSFLRTHRRLALTLGALAVVVLAGALAVFKPWLLFIDTEVNDEVPVAVAPARPAGQDGSSAATGEATGGSAGEAARGSATDGAPTADSTEGAEAATPQAQEQPTQEQQTPSGPVLVSSGDFISHEHETSGTASIVRHPDGSYQLVLENLETSNGPDVRVWLSAGPVVEGRAGWFTAGDYDHLDVAPIKGNLGNQVYDLPADFDPSTWPTVDLWCEDFSVSFGAAALTPAA